MAHFDDEVVVTVPALAQNEIFRWSLKDDLLPSGAYPYGTYIKGLLVYNKSTAQLQEQSSGKPIPSGISKNVELGHADHFALRPTDTSTAAGEVLIEVTLAVPHRRRT
ncbi:MAG: hypothetical protein KY455_10175 [Euryarchaeota archaeon]|nr:hypothetical protein [Euryarchaeota archaeon]